MGLRKGYWRKYAPDLTRKGRKDTKIAISCVGGGNFTRQYYTGQAVQAGAKYSILPQNGGHGTASFPLPIPMGMAQLNARVEWRHGPTQATPFWPSGKARGETERRLKCVKPRSLLAVETLKRGQLHKTQHETTGLPGMQVLTHSKTKPEERA